MKRLVIGIPAYNEEELIEAVIKAVPVELIRRIGFEPEIVIVNTSTDKTEEKAKALGATVINEERRGYGRAYKTLFESLKPEDMVCTFDCDMTYPPSQIIVLLTHWLLHNQENMFISGNRFAQPDKGAFKTLNWLGNKGFNFIIKRLFGIVIHDSQSGMWLTTKEVVDSLALVEDGMPLSTEIKLSAISNPNVNFVEVPVSYKSRPNMPKLKMWEDGKKIIRFMWRRYLRKDWQ